jgi:hypothetical protein
MPRRRGALGPCNSGFDGSLSWHHSAGMALTYRHGVLRLKDHHGAKASREPSSCLRRIVGASVYAGELKVRPPAAPITGPLKRGPIAGSTVKRSKVNGPSLATIATIAVARSSEPPAARSMSPCESCGRPPAAGAPLPLPDKV